MEASAQLKEVETSLIEISGDNPRKDIKGESFKEFKQSIAELGILEPLIVRPKGKKYELIAGERRLTAARELKLAKVPVSIREVDDHETRVFMLIENLQREDLQPLEEAAAIEELLRDTGDGGMTQVELAKKLGKSQPWIANRVRLLKAPKDLKKLLEQGEISPQHVIVLLPYMEHKDLSTAIIDEVKQDLENTKKWDDRPVTVDFVKRLADDTLAQMGQSLELNDYQYQGLDKFFDYSACETCKKTITVPGEKDKPERSCLDNECFQKRLNAARDKFAETQKEKLSKSEIVTQKLDYGSYRSMDDATFDKTACKDCERHKFQKPRYARFGKAKDELEEICLKPSCFQGKTAQKTRVKNIACREELSFVAESLKQYLASRPAGLTVTELRFILDQVDMGRSPKKTASLKDLEGQLLEHAMEIELRDIKYSLNLARLKQVQNSWPFTVKRKKVKEIRKKKVG